VAGEGDAGRVLVQKYEGKDHLEELGTNGRPRPRWKKSTKMDLEEVRWGDWCGSG
jgi:hypothetical protein